MKKKFISIILCLLFSTKAASHLDHFQDIKTLEYELFRNGKSIGYHKYEFEKSNDVLNVRSIIEFKISKLGIDLYSYNGSTEEKYKKTQLLKFSSKTNQNKKLKNTEITFDKGKNKLIISGSENQLDSPKEYPVGTWWNHEIIQAKAQISGVSGRIIKQEVTFLGKEKIKLYEKEYDALRFNFKSSDKKLPEKKKLNIDIWYEEKNNLWLKASFQKNGKWEYRLKKY